MDWNSEKLLLYAVTDRTWTKKQTLFEQIESAIKGGVTCVQLREKEMEEKKLLEEAHQKGCHSYYERTIKEDCRFSQNSRGSNWRNK